MEVRIQRYITVIVRLPSFCINEWMSADVKCCYSRIHIQCHVRVSSSSSRWKWFPLCRFVSYRIWWCFLCYVSCCYFCVKSLLSPVRLSWEIFTLLWMLQSRYSPRADTLFFSGVCNVIVVNLLCILNWFFVVFNCCWMFTLVIHSFIHIHLLIITITERIMQQWKTCRMWQWNNETTTKDKECQYTCLYNIHTMKLPS